MLNNLRFQTQVLLLPTFAAVAFLVVLAANLILGNQSKAHLVDIERGYFPALQMSLELEGLLDSIQRGLQDAVAAADEDGVRVTQGLRDQFLLKVQASKELASTDGQNFTTLATAFSEYYILAAATSDQMIDAADGILDADLVDKMKVMRARYTAIKQRLELHTLDDRTRMAVAFDAARDLVREATMINVVVSLLGVGLLLLLSLVLTRGVVQALGGAVGHLSAASAELLAISKQTEASAADQAAAVDETRRTMDALVDASGEISDSSAFVLESAERSAGASKTIGERIAKLNAQAFKISDVSEVIRTIADKSDILALNASLEGTKAGDAGRGFVLVGNEMRRLTETVMEAVRQIKDLANEIRELSQAAVLATEEGQTLARQTTETSQRISMITAQQRTGTQQVSQSMDEIQTFAQQSLSGAKQGRATAGDLVRTANELGRILNGKHLDESRGDAQAET